MPDEIDPTTKLAMFMAASPFYVDLDDPNEKDTIADRFDALPQNIQNILIAEETAAKIWNLAVLKHGLTADHVRHVARTVRDLLMGRASVSTLRTTLQQRLETPQAVTDDIVKVLTQELITPHYFQIAQEYERKRRAKGSAGTMAEIGNDELQTPAARPTPPRVVDLRNGAIPSRLPPPPRVAPEGAEWGPSPSHPSAPPPPAAQPPGPPEDEPESTLQAPPVRPRSGGEHGPLPTRPSP